jgi:hypothetical protein
LREVEDYESGASVLLAEPLADALMILESRTHNDLDGDPDAPVPGAPLGFNTSQSVIEP